MEEAFLHAITNIMYKIKEFKRIILLLNPLFTWNVADEINNNNNNNNNNNCEKKKKKKLEMK